MSKRKEEALDYVYSIMGDIKSGHAWKEIKRGAGPYTGAKLGNMVGGFTALALKKKVFSKEAKLEKEYKKSISKRKDLTGFMKNSTANEREIKSMTPEQRNRYNALHEQRKSNRGKKLAFHFGLMGAGGLIGHQIQHRKE